MSTIAKLMGSPRRTTRALITFLLLLLLSSCDLPNNQTEAEAEATSSQTTAVPDSLKNMSHLLLGTGSVQGVYFPIGGVICRLLNRHKNLHKIRCSLESTGGSIYNSFTLITVAVYLKNKVRIKAYAQFSHLKLTPWH
jgi:hypothetical protein